MRIDQGIRSTVLHPAAVSPPAAARAAPRGAEAQTVVLYGTSELAGQAAAALRSAYSVECTVNLRAFECALPRSRCGLAVIERLDCAGEFGELRLLKARAVHHPLILITRRHPESLRLLKDIILDDVIWPSELNRLLLVAVQRACGQNLFRQIADEMQTMPCIHPRVRAALAVACWVATPVTSVTALAATVRCDRRTLWRAWSSHPGAHPGVRLEDLVGWILLIRAVSLRSGGRGWSAIASEFRVSQRRLLRLAQRLAGLSLSRVAALGPDHLYARFRDEILSGAPAAPE
ncbi:MAG: hypothetical protein KY467_06280 [Gemmatimonadetes bacterium]|nr:hypothetical protein [Gemmatimonadota bacterium]